MKKAIVDQIILWIVLFTIFVSFLFFIIDYSNVVKIKDNTDAIADYTARMVSLNKDSDDIVTGINGVKDSYFTAVTTADLICTTSSTTANYQVIVNIKATVVNSFLPVAQNNITSKKVVFNESSEYQKECTITLSFN